MTAPVRIRGEVGERRKLNPESRPGAFTRPEVFINGVWRRCRRHTEGFFEMRHDETTAARINAIVARFKAALAELQQQHREERARDAAQLAQNWIEAKWTPRQLEAARSLLAVMHGDGGHHTAEVGFIQACEDAQRVRHDLVRQLDLAQFKVAQLEGRNTGLEIALAAYRAQEGSYDEVG